MKGGHFEGEELKGTVLPTPAGDWLLLRRDGILMLNVRLTLKTDDGHLIYMRYEGMRHGPAWVIEAAQQGREGRSEPVLLPHRRRGSRRRRRSTASSIASSASATGRREPTGPVYEVFHIL